MAQSFNVICLISGGKDSFFSLLHCQANGHRIIALANLYPPSPRLKNDSPNEESDDLNSFMYQTVGHTLIPLYAEMLSLPLYRQEIRGTAVNTAKEYSTIHVGHDSNVSSSTALDSDDNGDDETESMITLLDIVKAQHPEANAVCSGAILSSYQRTRIESVALRMNLVPLAYLWQYPELPTPIPREGGLLEDMAAVGIDARIVKVASGGLDEDMLWENVCAEATRKKLAKAMRRFGGSILGEGGEFETLVIDGPEGFFEGLMEVGPEERKIIRGSGGEALLTFKGGTTMRRQRGQVDDRGWLEKLRTPNWFDRGFELLLDTLDQDREHAPTLQSRPLNEMLSSKQYNWTDRYHICTGRWTTRISNLSASHVKGSAQAQLKEICRTLMSLLEHEIHRSTADIVFTTILLRSMDDFRVVNQKYAELFGARPNPPARVTVACGKTLPPGVNVMVSVVIALGPAAAHQYLHVQSISYWAPANIGPYSQAASVRLGSGDDDAPAIVYIAGQIPLVPSSMEIVTWERYSGQARCNHDTATFRLQTTLALQHLWRIGKAMDVSWWVGAIAFVVAGEDDIRDKASIAALAWSKIHVPEKLVEETGRPTPTNETGFDVWNERCIDNRSFVTGQENVVLPDFSCLSLIDDNGAELSVGYPVVPPFFAVEIAQLPRGSLIEWQGLGVSRGAVRIFEPIQEDGSSITACSVASDDKIFGFISFGLSSTQDNLVDQIESAISVLRRRCKVFGTAKGHRIAYTSYEIDVRRFEAQIIPCRSVWSVRGEELAVAVLVEYEKEAE